VSVEKPVNGYTDLVLEKNGERVAVEIETGKSDWRKNVQKNLEHGFQSIIIITTNDKTYRKLKESLQMERLHHYVEIYRAQDFL
jgi:predicted RecB family endonuclease